MTWKRQWIVFKTTTHMVRNKANLRDLIVATGLVNLLKLNSNLRFFSPCDLEIWWMISKSNRAPLLYYVKLCASFQFHRLIQSGVTVRTRPNSGNAQFGSKFFVPCDLEIWQMILKIGQRCYTTSSFVHHFKAIGEFKLELESGNR